MNNKGGLALGSYVWTDDAPRPIEGVQRGEFLIGFSAAAFRQGTSVQVMRIEVDEGSFSALEFFVGGRVLSVHQKQRCLVFDMAGNWESRLASELQEGDWLPVARKVPTTDEPIALPDIDQELTALLDEDGLALLDSLYEKEKYFTEMGKRSKRIRLFELVGYLCGGGELMGDDLTLPNSEPELLFYYRDALGQTFGKLSVIPRLRRFLGDGLLPPPRRALPKWLWQIESQSQSAFLRGFFDACSIVSQQEVVMQSASRSLVTGVQALLRIVGVESRIEWDQEAAKEGLYQLQIRNVRRFAEWIGSNVSGKAGILRLVYAKEPRYPSDSSAILPLSLVHPALERIRAHYGLSSGLTAQQRVNERDLVSLSTLRLLSTAFDDPPLRQLVNQQLYLEPVTKIRQAKSNVFFALTFSEPQYFVANGIIIG